MNTDFVVDVGGGANPIKNRVRDFKTERYLILDSKVEEMKEGYEVVKYDLNEDGVPFIKGKKEEAIVDEVGVVFCLEVFEYVYDPKQAILNLWSMLRKGGVAYISFPFVYPLHEPRSIDYLRYTELGVNKFLEMGGFSEWVIDHRRDRSGVLKSFYTADGMHPVKGYDHSVYGFLVTAKK